MAEIKTIQFKRGRKAVLEAKLKAGELGVLLAGEPAWETDLGGLKIGDGVNAYADLPYITGSGGGQDSRFVINDPLANQVLLYDSTLGKWVNKDLSDDNSIIYLAQQGLTLKGYANASQGQMLVKDNTNGLTWVNPVSDQVLQTYAAAAEASKNEAAAQAIVAGNKAVEASTSATQANQINQQTIAWFNNKFWWGTLAEYNELESIDPGTFYFITVS